MERRLARVGFIIIIVFIVCQTAGILEDILLEVDLAMDFKMGFRRGEEQFYLGQSNDWTAVVVSVAFLLVSINHGINFLIYFFHGGNPTRKLPRLFCTTRDEEN